jgi:hypothetical protein
LEPTWRCIADQEKVFQTASKSFPESKTTNNWFARTAYLAGDYEVARNELKKIEYDWENWQKRIWGDKTIFEEVKRELSVK